jgi:hypothetical protein
MGTQLNFREDKKKENHIHSLADPAVLLAMLQHGRKFSQTATIKGILTDKL